MTTKQRRAVGIVRVSRTKGDDAVSPSEQRERIERECDRLGFRLVASFDELDVSGYRRVRIADRPGLRRAVAMVEADEADVVMAAYLDRMLRSEKVKLELVERVTEAGGDVWSLDIGQWTNGSAAKRLEVGMMTLYSQYQAETTAERTAEAKARAVARGVPPFARIPPGLRRRADSSLEHDPARAPLMAEAFEMKADRATVEEIRAFLRDNGISLGASTLRRLLQNRLYLGELRFGKLVNLHAVEPIVDPDTFRRAQATVVPRGPRPPSEELLARLGVLRCGTCGSRMVTSQTTTDGRKRRRYRCPNSNTSAGHVTIEAAQIHELVVEKVKELIDDLRGEASSDAGVAEAEAEFERADRAYAKALAILAGHEDVEEARGRLQELRRERDEASDCLHELRGRASSVVTVTAEDWDVLCADERRALIRAVIEQVVVNPGRGPERVAVEPR